MSRHSRLFEIGAAIRGYSRYEPPFAVIRDMSRHSRLFEIGAAIRGYSRYEPPFAVIRDMSRLMTKPTMWLCAQRRLRSAWTSAPSLIRAFAVRSMGS